MNAVNKVVRPRPLTATSIPGMLTLFQNEWDELMLETYALKQSLAATRQELAQALYEVTCEPANGLFAAFVFSRLTACSSRC